MQLKKVSFYLNESIIEITKQKETDTVPKSVTEALKLDNLV
jgi:hypothetical protein